MVVLKLADLDLIFLIDFAVGSAGISEGYGVCRNVPSHHGTRSNDAVVADGHARENRDVCAYPDVVSDVDRQGPFQPLVALFGVDGVGGRRETAVGRDKDMVAKIHLGRIQDDAVVVDVEGVPCGNVVSVVADEGLLDDGVLAQLAENFSKGRLALFKIAGTDVIVIEAKFFALGSLLDQVWIVVGIVKFAGQHFFLFRHLNILLKFFCPIYNF